MHRVYKVQIGASVVYVRGFRLAIQYEKHYNGTFDLDDYTNKVPSNRILTNKTWE